MTWAIEAFDALADLPKPWRLLAFPAYLALLIVLSVWAGVFLFWQGLWGFWE
jgi:hypothetical protein